MNIETRESSLFVSEIVDGRTVQGVMAGVNKKNSLCSIIN